MQFTPDSFRTWEHKRITLLGMSGVGKTHISTMLRNHDWFHFSGDYRIGTRYLDEPILDLIKQQAMQTPFLRDLLRRDWIDIKNNIKVHDLGPVLSFIGKLGGPEWDGLSLQEFTRRQALYREAEIAAMRDVAEFIRKGREIYGYPHFVNDVGGSLCELDEPGVIDLLAEHTLILYIQTTTREEEDTLIRRAQSDPKPLYYRPAFLAETLPVYLAETGLEYVAQVVPDDFTRWVFPRLFHSRIPRYEAIAKPHGYTVTSQEVAQVRNERDFLALVESAIARRESGIRNQGPEVRVRGQEKRMPLVAHNALPTFDRLRQDGMVVHTAERAAHQEIRELHVGLLNMMPDAALEATERQFFRLVGESNPIAQFYVHPFTLPALPRGEAARAHIARFYESFETIRAAGLDALIITGANVTHADLADELFWQPLIEIIDWAWDNVTSTLCSCLATHAVMQFRYGQRRVKQPAKIWGVYGHRVVDKRHPLVVDVNTRFDVPHSRWNDVSRAQFEAAGVKVLVESEAAGVHLAVSGDGLRTVFFQGHPEYDTVSLLKEYKRDLQLAVHGKLPAWPPFPAHYFDRHARAILEEYRYRLNAGGIPPEFPEALVSAGLDNTWHDTAEAVISNWIGCVYQVTHRERNRPFMPGIDPNNPWD